MNENQTLELEIKSSAEQAKNSVDTLVKSLTNVESVLTNIYLDLGRMEKNAKNGMGSAVNEVEKVNKSIRSTRDSADKAGKTFEKLGKAISLSGAYLSIKRLTQHFLSWMSLAVDKSEQLNLFNVVFKNMEKDGVKTFSTLGREATKFQYRLNEAFGTNMTETLKYQGLFQSMGENVGIPGMYSAIMSETMTKLTYDLASLYNKSESSTGEALRAGVYAGQTKPLRSFGIDVTQTSMQPILDELGIDDRTVKQMSQAEKEILRYIATLRQAKVAMGDFANTIESPANQMKIFKQQLVESKVAFTSLFIGTFSKILPYANAILMVIKEVSKAIANMFGIKIEDYNTGIATQEDYFDDLGDSIDDATGSAKELKRQILGFDEIHNINEDKNAGSGGNVVSGGIDQRLLDAIKGYDNGMDKVRMKATEIRDKIMEWLGFTKEIDPLTGEVSFKYGGIKKTLKNLWDSFKGLSTTGKILVGLGLTAGALKLWNAGKKLVSVFGNSGLGKVVGGILSPMKGLKNALDDVNFSNKSLTSGLAEGITSWSKSLSMIDKAKVALVGFLGLSLSMEGMKNAMKDVAEQGWTLGNSLQAVASGLGGIASGAYIGSIFGPWGAVIGGATGAVLELVSAINGYDSASEKMIKQAEEDLKVAKENLQNYYDTKKAIEDSMNNELAHHEYNKRLLDELKQIVDTNGKVKEGYEDRVKFILNQLNDAYGTEYSIIDGTIQGYENLDKTIKDVIQTKKAKIILDANEKIYTKAIEQQANAWSDYNEAIKKYNQTNEEGLQVLEKKQEIESLVGTTAFKNYKYYSKLTKQTYQGAHAYNAIVKDLEAYNKTLENNKDSMDEARELFESYTNDIVFYEDLQTAILSENVEEQNRLIDDRLNAITTANGKEKLSLSDQIKFYDDVSEQKLKILKENGVEITDEMKKQIKEQRETLINHLLEQSKTVETMTPEIVEAWATLGKQNEEQFLANFKKLPADIQTHIVSEMQSKGYSISSELQRGINQINPTITVRANTDSAYNSVYNMINNLSNQGINLKFFSSVASLFKANGGIYSNGSWQDIPQYENGGAPQHGSLFWAGENGAEIVANANRRTEVLNKSQIASAIYGAVLTAMSQVSGQSSQIDVHVHTDEGTVIDRVEQKIKQTGTFPWTIPG